MAQAGIGRTSAATPWSAQDAVHLAARLTAGAGLVAVAWFFVGGEVDPGRQIGYVSLSLLGGLVGLYAVLSWVLTGRRRIGTLAEAMLGRPAAPAVDVPSSARLVGGPGGRWFHRADCPLARGRDWPDVASAGATDIGHEPCPACRPESPSNGWEARSHD